MVQIKPFDVEQWMDKYETECTHNIAETCCDSISVNDLVQIESGSSQGPPSENPILASLSAKRLDYGHIRGSPQLRSNISDLYSTPFFSFPSSQVLITPGAIAANFLVFYTLIHPKSHVICIHPTYQQLYTVPESLGASVSLWKLDEFSSWSANISDLKQLIKPGTTKMIVLNNPNNPTGAIIPLDILQQVKSLAEENDITVLSDEVYAPLFHSSDKVPPPSFLSLGYKNTIVTGSLSKAFSLAGIRIGWIASNNPELIEEIASARDYNTISVSQLDDAVAAYALSRPVREKLVKRNIELCETNLKILDAFVQRYHRYVSYTKPVGGTTAFVQFVNPHKDDSPPVDDVSVCKGILEETGVLFVPGGHCFGVEEGEFKGYVRIGYACATQQLKVGLSRVEEYLDAIEREN